MAGSSTFPCSFLAPTLKAKDGKTHNNYWVYNIYSLDGSTFTLKNKSRNYGF